MEAAQKKNVSLFIMADSTTTHKSLRSRALQVSNPCNNSYFHPDEVPDLIADEKDRRRRERRSLAKNEPRPVSMRRSQQCRIRTSRTPRCTPSPTLVDDQTEYNSERDNSMSSLSSYSDDDGEDDLGILSLPLPALQNPPRHLKSARQQRDELLDILLAQKPTTRAPDPEHRRVTAPARNSPRSYAMDDRQLSSEWHAGDRPLENCSQCSAVREEVGAYYDHEAAASARNSNPNYPDRNILPPKLKQTSTHLQPVHLNQQQQYQRFSRPTSRYPQPPGLSNRRIDSWANSRHRRLRLGVDGLSYIDEQSERSAGHSDFSTQIGGAHEERYNEHVAVPQPSMSMHMPPRMSVMPTRASRCPADRSRNYVPKSRRPVISQQPSRHPGMQYRPNRRNAKGMPYDANGKRDWSTDLCLFCDHNLGTCCKALWCPCIVYGRNKARIEYLYEEGKVHPTRGGTFSDDCAIHACLTTFCLFGWAIQVPNRASIRRRYDIEGDWIGDCAAALFCYPCELSQESREIDLEERSFGEYRTAFTSRDRNSQRTMKQGL